MIIMKLSATDDDIYSVVDSVLRMGLRVTTHRINGRMVIGIVGDEHLLDVDRLSALPGVKECLPLTIPYKLVGKEYGKTVLGTEFLEVCGIGTHKLVFIAGPCAVESEYQIRKIASELAGTGADILRGGVFKPRTSVHSFQGLSSEDALCWLRMAGKECGLLTITEVRTEEHAKIAAEYVDILQVGARNMYNQDLLAAVGRVGKPVLLKRHFGAGIEELLQFAEYIAAEANPNIILCERGILPVGKGRQFTRYTLDLAAVPILHRETYLPVVVDPSHATGSRVLVPAMAAAGVAAGADGIMIEVHYEPDESWVDAAQTVDIDTFKRIVKECRELRKLSYEL